MTVRFPGGVVGCSLLLLACHSTRPIPTAKQEEPAIQLDTIQVTANVPEKREPYREAAPINFDIIHTELQVVFDWKTSKLYGKASLQLKPHFYTTDRLYLNARGMEIRRVEVFDVARVTEKANVSGKVKEEQVDVWNTITASTYKYANDSLRINLGRPFKNKETFYVEIEYVANPNALKTGGSDAITDDKGLYFINPSGENPYKMPQIWTQGETQANSAWFPTIDQPNVKTTQEIYMTVEDKYTTLSNGVLKDSKRNSDGSRTDHWEMDLPHSPYLAMMAVGEFRKVVDQPWNGKEISYYVEKEYEPYAKAIFGDTREMIEFYSTKLGVPYPWAKYAQVVVRDYVSGAMENTSATLHGDFMVYQTPREMVDGKKGNSVIAHELFHQWFGDLATCESWSNLPLNESFATYGEYLWEEYKNGREAADHHAHMSRLGYLNSREEVDLIRFNYDNREDMFDAFSYNKGGQVLHMLRKAVGDDAFFASLKKYLENNKYKATEIHHLRLAFEEVTGRDMNWFFNQWFLNKGRPKLKVTKAFNTATNRVELTVEQTQDLKTTPLYTLPIEVDLYSDGDVTRKRLLISEPKQTFTLVVDAAPQLVNFDAERQLLCDLDYPKTTAEYLFQYNNAPLYGDRYEALEKLADSLNNPAVFTLFTTAARKDAFFSLRNFAIGKLQTRTNDKPLIKALLTDIYKTDKNTSTRARTLEALNKMNPGDPEIMALNMAALGEQSYLICGEALEAIIRQDANLGMEKARMFEQETGKKVLFPIAELYSKQGSDAQLPFFRHMLKYVNGFEMMTFCNYYGKTAARCTEISNMRNAARDLAILGKDANKFSKYALKKAVKDLLTAVEKNEKTTQAVVENGQKENKNVSAEETRLKGLTELKQEVSGIYDSMK